MWAEGPSRLEEAEALEDVLGGGGAGDEAQDTTAAARILGISRPKLAHRLRKYEISPAK